MVVACVYAYCSIRLDGMSEGGNLFTGHRQHNYYYVLSDELHGDMLRPPSGHIQAIKNTSMSSYNCSVILERLETSNFVFTIYSFKGLKMTT
jgi:hypothetical protein